MVAPRLRSGRKARVHKKMPGGSTTLTFRRRKPSTHSCAVCKKALKGIPRMNIAQARNTPKSMKTVERKYGGYMCATCLKAKLKSEVRSK
jgi:large subunit ribosomal protein L34e